MTNLEVYIISIWELISSEVPSLEPKKNLNSWYIPERPSCFEDIRTEPLKSDTLLAGLPQSPGKRTCLLGNPKLKIRQDEGITGKNHRFLKKTYFRIVALGAWLVFVGRFVYIFPLTLNKIHHLSRWNPMILCATSNFLYISKHFGLRRDFWDHQPPRCVAFPFFAFFFLLKFAKKSPSFNGKSIFRFANLSSSRHYYDLPWESEAFGSGMMEVSWNWDPVPPKITSSRWRTMRRDLLAPSEILKHVKVPWSEVKPVLHSNTHKNSPKSTVKWRKPSLKYQCWIVSALFFNLFSTLRPFCSTLPGSLTVRPLKNRPGRGKLRRCVWKLGFPHEFHRPPAAVGLVVLTLGLLK